MAIHWKIPFMSLRSQTLYTVNIYDDDFSGTVVQLTGGAQPFVTEEDDDDDWFLPVRTQSGYISIVDNERDSAGHAFDWRDLLPATEKSRKVTLTDANNNVVWEGYMQPQTFSGQLYEGVQERSFPVCCPLSVLDGEKYDITDTGLVSFAALLEAVLLKTGFIFDYIYIQGTDPLDWLKKKVEWENLIDTDSNGTRTPRYSCLELLEEICKFWGWTCRIYRNNIYLLNPDDDLDPALIYFPMQDLATIAAGGTAQYNEASWSTADTDDDIYANDDNEIELMRGIRKATVTANINKQEVLFELPMDEIKNDFRNCTFYVNQSGDNYNIIANHVVTEFENTMVDVTCYWDQDNIRGSIYAAEHFTGDISTKHNIDLEYYCRLKTANTVLDQSCLRIVSKVAHSFSEGMITINGAFRDDCGAIRCYLKVGDNVWNGSAWTHQDATFYINCADKKISDTRELFGEYDAYTGLGIPVDNIGGIVDFRIVGLTLNSYTYDLTSLSIGFVKKQSEMLNNDRSENVYTKETGAAFTAETSVDTVFASDDDNAFGFAIIRNPDGGYCNSVGYSYSSGGAQAHPEQHLVERISNRGMTTKNKEVVHLLSNLVEITPLTLCETLYTSGYPVAISRDWRDDVTTVTIIEK